MMQQMYDRFHQSDSHALREIQRPGFTLVEAVISMLIVGLMLVAALGTLGASARARHVQTSSSSGFTLARGLLTEVLQAAYEDPEDPGGGISQDSGESGGDRGDFDDVDDYDGWTGSPPEHEDGSLLADASGWQRQVTVTYANPVTLAAAGTTSDTGLKLITVTATGPTGEVTTLQALRSRSGAGEQPPQVDTTYVSWVGVELEIGGAPPATASINLLNHATGGP